MTNEQLIERLAPFARSNQAMLLDSDGGFALMAAKSDNHVALQQRAHAAGMVDLCVNAYGIPLWTIPWSAALPSGYFLA